MSHELFFIPILAEALGSPDVRQALEDAFAAIEQRAGEGDYQEGYRNFQTFMLEIEARRQVLQEQDVRMALLMSAADASAATPERETIMGPEIRRSPELRAQYDALCEALSPYLRVPVFQLLRDGRPMGPVSFETGAGRRAIDDIRPGRYTLQIDTGLVLWEGELTARDLIWTEAFGGRSLELAAESGEIRRRPARTIHVPESGVILRIFPGIESGSLEIELTP